MIGIVVGVLTGALHAATAWRYGYFRDELYFIACSKHLAWGYVDQPPLVAVAAWLSAPAGYELLALRALPVLAAAATVWVAAAIVRELGGGRFAQALAAIATALTPAYLLLGNVLTTTSLEPLTWALAAYAAIRLVRRGATPQSCALLAGAVVLGAYGKYSIGLLAVALALGLLLTPQRRVLASPALWIAFAAGALLLAPNLWWQASHGWPMLAVLTGDAQHRPAFQSGVALEYRSVAANALAFAVEQLVYTNPVAAPLWIAGIVAPFALRPLQPLRFLSIAYVAVFAVAVLASAKGYYVIGIYTPLFAVGAAAFEGVPLRWLKTAALSVIVAVGVVSMPLSIPLLPVDALVAYTKALGLTGRDGTPARLIQPVFAEEFGWERLARNVAAAYATLPPAQRTRTAIYADTYADAGAIDFFGPRYGLPGAISSQNSYYLWGTRGYDGTTLLAIGATRIDLLRKYYRRVTLVATSTEPYKWVVEGASPIYLCEDPVAPLPEIWPQLRWYGA